VTSRGVYTNFPTPTGESFPWEISAGPDGNLWFTENFVSKIGRITLDGVITEFPIPNAGGGTQVFGITRGPDGYMWFTGPNMIGKIHP
jgi:virginiamycin B lyase